VDGFDVAIIGGGIAGAAAAWALAPQLRVVVLEAEIGLGYHSTGRSAAILTETYEAAPIRELTGRSRTILTSEFANVPGLLAKRGVLWVASTGQDAAVERTLAAARGSPATVELLDPGAAQALCPVLRRELCLAALHEPGAMAIDVDLLQQEYLRRARSHGATVRTNARVTDIRHEGQWHLTIDGTTVRCSHVVNAAGAWADEVAIMAGLRPIGLTPLRRTAFLFPAPVTRRGRARSALTRIGTSSHRVH
jgi:D-arginine dehydrogenase